MNAASLLLLYPRTWRARHGAAMHAELERRSATFVDVVDLGLDALDSRLQPEEAADAIPDQPTAGIAGARPSRTWMSVLFAHVVVFVVVNAILAAVNLLTDRSTLWFVYPMWGTGITLLLHFGLTFPGRDFLRSHALLSAWIAFGLLGTDVMTGGPDWAMWATWPLASLVVIHALRSRRVIDVFGSHALLAMLVGVELLSVTIVNLSTASDLA